MPPTKVVPKVAVALRTTLALKFSATAPVLSRASTLTLNGLPAWWLATVVVIISRRAVTLKLLDTPLVTPDELAVIA